MSIDAVMYWNMGDLPEATPLERKTPLPHLTNTPEIMDLAIERTF